MIEKETEAHRDAEMIEKEARHEEEMKETEAHPEADETTDLHPGVDHHHQRDQLVHSDLFMPIFDTEKTEVHHVHDHDHPTVFHPDPSDLTKNQVQAAENQSHPKKEKKKTKTTDNLVIEQFRRRPICTR
jgi:hypothetical protein